MAHRAHVAVLDPRHHLARRALVRERRVPRVHPGRRRDPRCGGEPGPAPPAQREPVARRLPATRAREREQGTEHAVTLRPAYDTDPRVTDPSATPYRDLAHAGSRRRGVTPITLLQHRVGPGTDEQGRPPHGTLRQLDPQHRRQHRAEVGARRRPLRPHPHRGDRARSRSQWRCSSCSRVAQVGDGRRPLRSSTGSTRACRARRPGCPGTSPAPR